MTTPDDVLPWQPGDIVLDATGYLFQRADPARTPDPLRVWGDVNDGRVTRPVKGKIEDDCPERPLTLLVRDGKPVGGLVVSEQEDAMGDLQRGEASERARRARG
jgi:hypothetical protein